MINPRFNVPHRFPGLDRRRTGHAANPLPGCLRGVAQVRIGLGKRLAFHGCIIAEREIGMTGTLPINIDNLLRQRTVEGERIEYKTGWNPKAVLHTICAFANDFHNLGGGYVVLGVEARDGRTILVLWAPGGETRPYKAKVNLAKARPEWAWFIRKHSSTVRAKGSDERELLSLAATVPFDDRYRQTASLDDLSCRLVQGFLRDIGSDLALEAADLPMAALGQRMNIVGGPPEAMFPKNVGLLFFNDRPHDFFPATQIDVVWFPDGPGGGPIRGEGVSRSASPLRCVSSPKN